MKTLLYPILLAWLGMAAPVIAVDLDALEQQALADDPGLRAKQLELDASRRLTPAAAALDDPRLRLSLANVPVDSFDFNAEPMTQAIVGLSQAFPAGETRRLRQDKAEQSEQLAATRVVLREKEVLRSVRMAWLEIWASRRKAALLAEKEDLLRLMAEVAKGRYGSGDSSQRQIATLTLELAQLGEARLAAEGLQRSAQARLQRWVSLPAVMDWPDTLPDKLSHAPLGDLGVHPALQQTEARSRISDVDTDLERQRFKPSWALETSFGYREDLNDFISVGVSVSLPGFNRDRNHATVAASDSNRRASEAQTEDQRRQLLSMQLALQAEVVSLQQRISQFEVEIIPQTRYLARLAESDYAAGPGDFMDSLASRRQTIDQQLSLLELQQQLVGKVIQLHWLLEEPRS